MDNTGQCKCGAIAFGFAGAAAGIVNCHCDMCKRMNGSAFSTYVVVAADKFALERGEAAISSYAVSERATRHFCRHCGTAVFNTNPVAYPGLRMLYLGTLRDVHLHIPAINIYADSKLDWVDRLADIKQLAAGPRPGR